MTNLDKFNYRNLPFSAWLYRIAYNEVMQYFRKEKKERKVVMNEEVLLLLTEDADDGDIDNIKRKFKIIFQILDLNELEFIQLRFYEGLSFQEIGSILGITENYAKVKTHRILEKIRHKYKLI
jgi:RNA polymerase sigma-70 factor, ECF subfamily